MNYTLTYGRTESNNIFDLVDNGVVGDEVKVQRSYKSDAWDTYRVTDVVRDPEGHAYKQERVEISALIVKKDGTFGSKTLKVRTVLNWKTLNIQVETRVYMKAKYLTQGTRELIGTVA
jgi:hypothetical protein